MPRITIVGAAAAPGTPLVVDALPGDSLFDAAAKVSAGVDTACVGKGTCGLCRVKILAGAGPKLNHIVWAPYVVDSSNLADIADPSWVPEDGTDLAPEGVYFTDEQTAEFFSSPELGPQTAD